MSIDMFATSAASSLRVGSSAPPFAFAFAVVVVVLFVFLGVACPFDFLTEVGGLMAVGVEAPLRIRLEEGEPTGWEREDTPPPAACERGVAEADAEAPPFEGDGSTRVGTGMGAAAGRLFDITKLNNQPINDEARPMRRRVVREDHTCEPYDMLSHHCLSSVVCVVLCCVFGCPLSPLSLFLLSL